MKKLLIAIVLLISVQLVAQPPRSGQGRPPQGQGQPQGSAQSKDLTDALSALEKAKKDTENASKATNPATWLKLSTSYTNLYEAPVKTLWTGASNQELRILLAGQRAIKSETQVIQGEEMTVDTYADKILYFDADGILSAWKVVSDKIPQNTLQEAMNSVNKAIEVDAKNQKTKDIVEQLNKIKSLYTTDGLSANAFGNFADASKNFEEAYNISMHKMIGSIDTTLVYYAGLTAVFANDYDRAIKLITIAIDNQYYSDGDAYSRLADAYKAKSNLAKAKDILNTGFQRYPNNQMILISLINVYIESNDDPEKILDLVRSAQRNEPNNPSLYYAEGDVWKNLGNLPEALKCYEKSTSIDPNYVLGYYATGSAYYDHALEIQRRATEESDDAKYEVLAKEMEASLESAIKPLEKGFEIATDPEYKTVLSEYLKNIYFRFREKGPEYNAAYEKYNNYFLGK